MFSNCYSLKSVDFSGIDTSFVTDMSYMFCNCYALAKLDLCSFDTSRLAGADCNDGYFTKK
ncbi:BspA family leucine-rich repeat surface protein [Treponema sp.]|uniref:BspA family leucine-rich repeat surface protein n=1 Tax=Treponema sp. TaxID=166 RepID=UPI00298DADF1|nr:BspA family leucine-rich repeat surface protein [Treponema sp.]